MLISADVPFMLIRPFYAYHCAQLRFMLISLLMLIGAEYAAVNAYHCGKKLKSIYLETTDFSATVCPVGVFLPAKSRSVPFRFISLIFFTIGNLFSGFIRLVSNS